MSLNSERAEGDLAGLYWANFWAWNFLTSSSTTEPYAALPPPTLPPARVPFPNHLTPNTLPLQP